MRIGEQGVASAYPSGPLGWQSYASWCLERGERLGPRQPGGRGRSRCCRQRPSHAGDLSHARTVKGAERKRSELPDLGWDGCVLGSFHSCRAEFAKFVDRGSWADESLHCVYP
jgi:hypothetical protein